MASRKISQLAIANPLTGAEILPGVQEGNNVRFTVADVFDGAAVISVNGQTGVVVLDASDVGAIAPGDSIGLLTNDVGYITSAQAWPLAGTGLLTSDVTINAVGYNISYVGAANTITTLTDDIDSLWSVRDTSESGIVVFKDSSNKLALIISSSSAALYFDGEGIIDKGGTTAFTAGTFLSDEKSLQLTDNINGSNFTNQSLINRAYADNRYLLILSTDRGEITTVNNAGWSVDVDINKQWTGTHSFRDGNFTIRNQSVNTKTAQFDTSLISVATTRTFTFPNESGTIALVSDLDSFWPLAGAAALTSTVTIDAAENDISITGLNSFSLQNSAGPSLTISDAGVAFSGSSAIVSFSSATNSVVVNTSTIAFTTNSISRLVIENDGSWNVNGSNGTAGYVLTTNGDGSSPTWQASTGGISGLTVNRIPYATSATTLGDDSTFLWDSTNNALTVGTARFFSIDLTYDSLFWGESAGNFTTSGTGGNIGIGRLVLDDISTGENNICIGGFAGGNRSTANFNIFIGLAAGYENTGGPYTGNNDNIGIGRQALDSMTNGASTNVAVGLSAGSVITSGNSNTLLGSQAGDNITTGSNNIVIGALIDAQSATSSNQLSIQNSIFGSGNSATGTAISSGNIGLFATSWGTSAAKVIAVGNGTEPSGGNPADAFQMYSKDAAAGNACAHFQTESGQIIKLFTSNSGSAWNITNGTPDRSFDADATNTNELADCLYTLIQDLKETGLIA